MGLEDSKGAEAQLLKGHPSLMKESLLKAAASTCYMASSKNQTSRQVDAVYVVYWPREPNTT